MRRLLLCGAEILECEGWVRNLQSLRVESGVVSRGVLRTLSNFLFWSRTSDFLA